MALRANLRVHRSYGASASQRMHCFDPRKRTRISLDSEDLEDAVKSSLQRVGQVFEEDKQKEGKEKSEKANERKLLK